MTCLATVRTGYGQMPFLSKPNAPEGAFEKWALTVA